VKRFFTGKLEKLRHQHQIRPQEKIEKDIKNLKILIFLKGNIKKKVTINFVKQNS